MRPHLVHFLTNNDPPPDEVLAEVDELTSGPKAQIKSKLAEIQRLRKKLEELQQERDGIQTSMEKYTIILSPIRRISPDILERIFQFCLPTNHNSVMSISEAPLLLIRVCRLWRSTALSSPALWAKLHIAIPHPLHDEQYFSYPSATSRSEAEQEADKRRFVKVVEARRQLMKLWLSRSSTHPLSLSITFMGNFDDELLEEMKQEGHLPQLFETLISFSRQFDQIDLDLPYNLCHLLLSRIPLADVSTLRQLRISLCDRIPFSTGAMPATPLPGAGDNVRRTITLFQAPGLKRLSVRGDAIAHSAFDSNKLPDSWANLSHLSLDFGINSTDVLHVFRLCENLEDCRLVVTDCQDVYIDPDMVIPLPHLKFLCLKINGPDLMSLLYKRLQAPSLNWFEYQSGGAYYSAPRPHGFGYYSPGAYQNTQNITPTSPVLSLIESSRQIKTLVLDPRNLSHKDMLFGLRFARHLTHLIIGQRPLQNLGWAATSGLVYFNLDLLVVPKGPTAFQKEVLLPHLEVFEAYNFDSKPSQMDNVPSILPTITDEIVKQFILGRLGNAARGVSSLKSVKISFSRKREEPIEEEIQRCAEEAHLNIDLDLQYAAPQMYSKYRDTFSPYYGLSEDDRSWRYVDADADDDD